MKWVAWRSIPVNRATERDCSFFVVCINEKGPAGKCRTVLTSQCRRNHQGKIGQEVDYEKENDVIRVFFERAE